MSTNFEVLQSNNVNYVLTEASDRYGMHPDANFMNTRKALCGVIRRDETLEQWITKKKKRMKKFDS